MTQDLSQHLQQIQNLLELGLLLTALFITNDRSISRIISIYQLQSLLIAIVTGLSLVTPSSDGPATGIIVFIVFLPLLMILVVRPLLARATVLLPSELVWMSWHLRMLRGLMVPGKQTRVFQRDAEQEWLQPRGIPEVGIRHSLVLLIILLAALMIATELFPQQLTRQPTMSGEQPRLIGLLASLVLGLVGLYNMVIKQDIISQVVGLLMMDHGLYLAVVKIVPIPLPATFFMIGLYFYTVTTMFILVIVLPGVRHVTGGIKLATIEEQSDLTG